MLNTLDTLNNSRGMRLDVLRPAHGYDGTNKGISSRHRELTLVGIRYSWDDQGIEPLPKYARVFTPTHDAPAVVLTVYRYGTLTPGEHSYSVHLTPADLALNGPRPMFGGNFATGDSRIRQILDQIGQARTDALMIHDRVEH